MTRARNRVTLPGPAAGPYIGAPANFVVCVTAACGWGGDARIEMNVQYVE